MKPFLNSILCILLTTASLGQKPVTLHQYESLFLKNNLLLIAEQFNIDAAKAAVIQARLWENPYVTGAFNAVNPEASKFADAGRRGQKEFAIEQLIYLGGKKKKEVELARANAEVAEVAFKDLLRNLKFQLRTSFFEVYYNTISAASFEKQLNNLDSLIKSYNLQSLKGNIPLKDVVRLQALYISLRNEQTQLLNNIAEEQNRLNIFASTDNIVLPKPHARELAAYEKQLSLSAEDLQHEAVDNRTDVLMADKIINVAKRDLEWQKALAVPDLTIGSAYDQRGGAFNNQVNLTLGIPLRLWNSNQGNIKMADIRVSQARTEKQQLLVQLKSEVNTAYNKYLVAKNNVAMIDTAMHRDFDLVYNGIFQNFQRRNVSLIEFADFMESYNQSLVQFNQIRKAFIQACEEINYSTGTTIF